MKAELIRDDSSEQGAYGKLYFDGVYVCETLSPDKDDTERYYIPPNDEVNPFYKCVRHSGTKWKNTFEIIRPGTNGIDGHSELLFHILNWETQSLGCIGVGLKRATVEGKRMLINSKVAFSRFMDMTKELKSFELIIKDNY